MKSEDLSQSVNGKPVGNIAELRRAVDAAAGRVGAMIFGRPEKDRLQLNEIIVWSGGPVPLKIQ
jgi:hypothetical protein